MDLWYDSVVDCFSTLSAATPGRDSEFLNGIGIEDSVQKNGLCQVLEEPKLVLVQQINLKLKKKKIKLIIFLRLFMT